MNKATFNTGGQEKAMKRAREIIGGREGGKYTGSVKDNRRY